MNSSVKNPTKTNPLSDNNNKSLVVNGSVKKTMTGKENVECLGGSKIPTVSDASKQSAAFIARKAPDVSCDNKPLRPKGLTENENESTSRRTYFVEKKTSSDVGVPSTETYPKSSVPVYADGSNTPNDAEANTEKIQEISHVHNKKPSRTLQEDKKKLSSDASVSNNKTYTKYSIPSIVHDADTQNDADANIGEYKQMCNKIVLRVLQEDKRSVKSPQDLPHIPKTNVFKIKEEHKRVSEKKDQRPKRGNLSLELAYNMDYMAEYIRFQMEINDKKKLSDNFLKKNITPDQRRLIVKWLIRAGTYYKYPSFVLYQAVKIFDAYIDTVSAHTDELQILALAALWISLKKNSRIDETPDASTLTKLISKDVQDDSQTLANYERKILMSLNFEVSFSEPFSLLALYTVMLEEVQRQSSSQVQDIYYCGSYLIDLSLLHHKIYNLSAVHLAAICAEMALVITMPNIANLDCPKNYWRNRVYTANPILAKYRLPEEQMDYIGTQLMQKVIQSKEESTDYHAVYKKYSTKRYGPISQFITSKITAMYLKKVNDPVYRSRPIVF
ncbi:hypothetical protein TKK_0006151 [Trichogramma kaykai]|uniref:Cyclin N-terminal domain-containing protein n=1 Tax=Trichogramma kaykai TaxID=54128 RepID=A0ABD2XFL8_9HYME